MLEFKTKEEVVSFFSLHGMEKFYHVTACCPDCGSSYGLVDLVDFRVAVPLTPAQPRVFFTLDVMQFFQDGLHCFPEAGFNSKYKYLQLHLLRHGCVLQVDQSSVKAVFDSWLSLQLDREG
jgi:hypothetical protein